MTVKELIEMLSQFDSDAEVEIKTETFGLPILGIEESEGGAVLLDITY